MASFALPGRNITPTQMMISSQFKTKPKPPPSSTSLKGQTILVTGSNTGIGRECAAQLLKYGLSRLIMAVRTPAKGEKAAELLRAAYPDADIRVWPLEMGSYDSIKAFVTLCENDLPYGLDVAILNASVLMTKFKLSHYGHENSIQVNYLSTLLLCILLLPVLKPNATNDRATPGRLMIVSSNVALTCDLPQQGASPILPAFNDPSGFQKEGLMTRYSTSKLLQTVILKKLGELVSPDQVIVTAVDPGLVQGSELHRHLPLGGRIGFWAMKVLTARSLEQAAWIYMDAAILRGKESHGGFIVNWEIYP